jgi:hypothetical protein
MEIDSMVKGAAISIRVEPALKARLEKEAAKAGTTLAAYVERALEVHAQPPKLELSDPEVVHGSKAGTRIKLNVATGWPVALLTPDHAERLGKQLLTAVDVTKRIAVPPGTMKGYTEDPEEADRSVE